MRLIPLLILEVVDSTPKELVRLLEATTAAGNGGSRDDGGSTPALDPNLLTSIFRICQGAKHTFNGTDLLFACMQQTFQSTFNY